MIQKNEIIKNKRKNKTREKQEKRTREEGSMTLRRWSALSSLGGDAKKASTFANEKEQRARTGRSTTRRRPRERGRRRRGGGVKAAGKDGDDVNDDASAPPMNEKTMRENARKVRARGEGQGTFAKEIGRKGTTTTTTTKENLTIDELARMKPRGTGTKSRIDGR